jgi:hypothetical protein
VNPVEIIVAFAFGLRGVLGLNLVQLNSVSSAISTVRRTSMRFSLRDLLLFVAFAAAIAWCAAQVGFDNGLFWFVVGLSVVLSGVFVLFARAKKGRAFALVLLLPVLALSFLMGSISLFINSALLSTATVVLACRSPLPVRPLCVIAGTTTLVSLVAAVLSVVAYMHKLEAAAREIPTVSLVNKLRYERHRTTGASPRPTSVSVTNGLNKFEEFLDAFSERKMELKRLHIYQYRLFENSAGFGVQRMIPLRPSSFRRPPLRDIAFDSFSPDKSLVGRGYSRDDTVAPERGYWRAGSVSFDYEDAEQFHMASRNDFLDPDGFGIAIEPQLNVMGFVEHGFHYPPGANSFPRARWTILQIELVSLLKFDTPRVYVLDHLPRMDQLSSDDAPTRPLDAFETEALAKLWKDEDVVVKNDGDDYRMLGSLRAAKQCLDCHSVQRGELLGAFNYSLRHESPSKR